MSGKTDSGLIESTGNIHMVICICATEKHHTCYRFLTYTGNQKNKFGMKPIKNGFMDLNERNIIMIMKIFLLNIKNN